MVEKRIEFYFLKHPHEELDCGWSRKGSSIYERSLIMAKSNKTDARSKFHGRTAPEKRVIYLAQPVDCFEFRDIVAAAAHRGVREIEFRAIYVDYREPDFDAMATLECVRLCDFCKAVHLITEYGYRLQVEKTDAHLPLGRVAVTLEFVKEGNRDIYPESSRAN